MIRATFHIELPEGVWLTQVSRQFPQTTFRLLSGYRTGRSALELGEAISDQPSDIVAAMRAHPSIEDYECLDSDDRRVLGKYETRDTALYDFVEASSLTIEFPIDVQDGRFVFDLTGTRDEFDALRGVLDDTPLSYELLSLVRTNETNGVVTDRQHEVLASALRNGYFEVPRDCTLSELATELDIDKSTASTILRRGERRILQWFLADSPRHRRN